MQLDSHEDDGFEEMKRCGCRNLQLPWLERHFEQHCGVSGSGLTATEQRKSVQLRSTKMVKMMKQMYCIVVVMERWSCGKEALKRSSSDVAKAATPTRQTIKQWAAVAYETKEHAVQKRRC